MYISYSKMLKHAIPVRKYIFVFECVSLAYVVRGNYCRTNTISKLLFIVSASLDRLFSERPTLYSRSPSELKE